MTPPVAVAPKKLPKPRCPYCDKRAVLVDRKEIHRTCIGKVWLCEPCDAWAFAHPDPPHRPQESIAKHILRAQRAKAFRLFERVWRDAAKGYPGLSPNETRHFAHLWLAEEMGIPAEKCQIGFLGHAALQQVIDICSAVGVKKEGKAA